MPTVSLPISPSSAYRENGASRAVALSWDMSSIPASATINSIKIQTTLSITRTANNYARIQKSGDEGVEYLREYRNGTYTSSAVSTSRLSGITLVFRADTGVYVTFDSLYAIVDYTSGYAASTVSSVSAAAGETATFRVTNSSLSALNHRLVITFGTQTRTLTMAQGVATTTMTIPEAWLDEFTDAGSKTGTITCSTYSGSTLVGTKTATLTVTAPASAAPTVTLTPTQTGSAVPAGWGIYLQTISGVVLTASVTTQHSAAISAVSFSDGIVDPQNIYESTIGALNSSGQNTFTVTVRDSRGLTATASVTITVVPYSSPTFEATSLLRCDQSGNTTDQQGNPLDTGTYVLALADVLFSSCENNNAISIALDVDVNDVWVPVANLTDNTAQVCSAPPTSDFPNGFDPGVVYRFRIRAVDSLNRAVEKIISLESEKIFMHIRDDETGMAFGMVSQRAGFEFRSDWPLYVHGTEIIDLIYPIGSIYMSVNNVSPATLFGGTWVALEGAFLLGASTDYPVDGQIHGEATHILTEDEMPAHRHYPYGATDTDRGDRNFAVIKSITGQSGKFWMASGSDRYGFAATTGDTDVILRTQTGPAGEDAAHNNMPPYLAVYMWKRTA